MVAELNHGQRLHGELTIEMPHCGGVCWREEHVNHSPGFFPMVLRVSGGEESGEACSACIVQSGTGSWDGVGAEGNSPSGKRQRIRGMARTTIQGRKWQPQSKDQRAELLEVRDQQPINSLLQHSEHLVCA